MIIIEKQEVEEGTRGVQSSLNAMKHLMMQKNERAKQEVVETGKRQARDRQEKREASS